MNTDKFDIVNNCAFLRNSIFSIISMQFNGLEI